MSAGGQDMPGGKTRAQWQQQAKEIERLTAENRRSEKYIDIQANEILEHEQTIATLTAEHKAAELLWWDEKGALEDQISELQARVDELEGALQKIRTEPGDARDCRYIAGQALAATEQKGE